MGTAYGTGRQIRPDELNRSWTTEASYCTKKLIECSDNYICVPIPKISRQILITWNAFHNQHFKKKFQKMQVFLSSVSGTNEKKVKIKNPVTNNHFSIWQNCVKTQQPLFQRRSLSCLHPSMIRAMSQFSNTILYWKW